MNNGGPAFPTETADHSGGFGCAPSITIIPGMTLRDWFAGQASEEDIKAHRKIKYWDQGCGYDYVNTREQAKYDYADAMIAAQKKTE